MRSLALLAAVGCLGACEDKSTPKAQPGAQYGEPVGIELGAHGAVPALAIKVAVAKGRDPTPSVSSLAGAVYGAAAACPDFVKAIAAGKTVRLELAARHGVFESLGAPPDDLGTACMSAAFGGKPATMDKPDPLDVIVELTHGKG